MYQILTCPNCNGVGCPTCQNTGKVRVDTRELTKLKQMLGQISPAPIQQSPLKQDEVGPPSQAKPTAGIAGIITFSILSVLTGAAASSWFFLKSLKPFFLGLTAFLTLLGGRTAWTNAFFQKQEPDDYLSAIKQITNS